MRVLLLAGLDSTFLDAWVYSAVKYGIQLRILSFKPPAFPMPKNVEVVLFQKRLNKLTYFFMTILAFIHCKTFKPHLLLAHGLKHYGAIAFFSCFRPYVVQIYGSDVYISSKVFPRYYQRILLNAAKIFTSSIAMRNHLIKYFKVNPKNLFTFSWGVEIEKLNSIKKENTELILEKYNIPSGKIIFCSPRHSKPVYRTLEIIQAFSIIKQTVPDAHLVVLMGAAQKKSPYGSKIMSEIKRNQLQDSITVIDHLIPNDDVLRILNCSSFFFSLPKSDQLAKTLLEGIYMSAIPILSNLKPYHELVEDEEFFVKHVYPQEIANTAKFLHANHITAKEKLNRYQETIRQFHDMDKNFGMMWSYLENNFVERKLHADHL